MFESLILTEDKKMSEQKKLNIIIDPFRGERTVEFELTGKNFIQPGISNFLSKLIAQLRGNYVNFHEDPTPYIELIYICIERKPDRNVYEFVGTNFERKLSEIYDYAKTNWGYTGEMYSPISPFLQMS